MTFGGFITDKRMTAERMLATLEAAAWHFAALGARRLIYKAVPAIYHRTPASEDLYALYRAGAALVRRDVSSTTRSRCSAAVQQGTKGTDQARSRNVHGGTRARLH